LFYHLPYLFMKKIILLALGFAMLSASVYAQPATTAKAFRMYNAPDNWITIQALTAPASTGTFTWPVPAAGIFKSTVGGVMSISAVNLASADVTGTLPVGNGGTGLSAIPANNLLIGTGGSSLALLAPVANRMLATDAGGAISWASFPPPGFTVPFSSITTGDNTQPALMRVGTGSVLRAVPGSTGVVEANRFVTAASTTDAVDLATTEVSGTLPIANGGTNQTGAAVNGAVIWSDANSYEYTAVGVANQILKSNGAAAPTWVNANSVVTGSALTESDDANVQLTLTGTPATALLQGVNIAAGWSGQLSLARGGTNKNASASAGSVAYSDADSYEWTAVGSANQVLISNGAGAPSWANANSVVTGSALTESDDANVTLTLTGTPGTALLQSVNVAAGWSGQLSIARGGTNGTAAPTAGAVAYGTGAAYAFTAVGAAGQFLTSNGAGAPSWTSGAIAGAKGTTVGTGTYTYTVTSGLGSLVGRQIMITFHNAGAGGLQTTYSVVSIDSPNPGDFTVEFANNIAATEKFHWVIF
jgi:hypothetical protein